MDIVQQQATKPAPEIRELSSRERLAAIDLPMVEERRLDYNFKPINHIHYINSTWFSEALKSQSPTEHN